MEKLKHFSKITGKIQQRLGFRFPINTIANRTGNSRIFFSYQHFSLDNNKSIQKILKFSYNIFQLGFSYFNQIQGPYTGITGGA